MSLLDRINAFRAAHYRPDRLIALQAVRGPQGNQRNLNRMNCDSRFGPANTEHIFDVNRVVLRAGEELRTFAVPRNDFVALVLPYQEIVNLIDHIDNIPPSQPVNGNTECSTCFQDMENYGVQACNPLDNNLCVARYHIGCLFAWFASRGGQCPHCRVEWSDVNYFHAQNKPLRGVLTILYFLSGYLSLVEHNFLSRDRIYSAITNETVRNNLLNMLREERKMNTEIFLEIVFRLSDKFDHNAPAIASIVNSMPFNHTFFLHPSH